MSDIICPGCGAAMKPFSYPDVTIDECHRCGGVFLDKSELNALATGMAGDVEAAVVRPPEGAGAPSLRRCPRCKSAMLQVLLLQHSDVVLDRCEGCGGFYLDRGELDAANDELRRASSGRKSEEFWGPLGGHLVRVDRLAEVRLAVGHEGPDTLGGVEEAVNLNYLQVTVFFRQRLGLDLWIRRERLSARVAKALRLFRGRDLLLGDAAFDRAFLVQGTSPAAVAAVVTPAVREGLLDLQRNPPRIFSDRAEVEMFDDRVVYTEGPLSRLEPYPARKDPGGIIARLTALAAAVSAALPSDAS